MEELMKSEEEFEDMQQDRFLTFAIDNEVFGISISFVSEIIGMQKINDIPEVPSFVKGIINLRGKIISVIDMRLKFKKPSVEYDDRTCIIIVDINGLSAGLIVDNVSEVINIPKADISPSPDFRTGFQNRYINGIGKLKDSVVLILDCERLFKEDELEILSVSADQIAEKLKK
jgi:purine-binding chemotaxis protein CheW